jgi:hypothetical protein
VVYTLAHLLRRVGRIVATYNPINTFTKHLLEGVHNFTAAAHVVKAMLVNSPAPLATNVLKADLTEIAAGNGYTAGGNTLSTSTGAVTNSANKASVTADVTITATGAVGPFRYVVEFNDTPTSPLDPLICYWDYGSSISLANTETFTLDFDQSAGFVQVGSP